MAEDPNCELTPYQRMGGAEVVSAVVDRFYVLMDGDADFARLRQLHPPDLSETRELLLGFLSGWLGGPDGYFQRPESRCVMSIHRGLPIGPVEIEQWLTCMNRALYETRIDEAVRKIIMLALQRMASGMRNLPDLAGNALSAG